MDSTRHSNGGDAIGAAAHVRAASPPRCPACSGRAARFRGTKYSHGVWQCAACDAMFSTVTAGQRNLDAYAEHYRRSDFVASAVVRDALERVVRSVSSFRRGGAWLDVGYGEGALLDAAERHGWRCHGVEISAPVLEYGRRRGWTVTAAPRLDPRFASGEFDVVSMIEFIEHVDEPGEFFQDAHRWLRPGGLLYLTTPNARGLAARLLGLDWDVVDPGDHRVLWTPRALRHAVQRVGFRVDRLRTEGTRPSELLVGLRMRRVSSLPANRVEAAVGLSAAMSRTWLRRAVKRGANAGLNLFGVGETLKLWAVRGE